jgi:hypothetical protein
MIILLGKRLKLSLIGDGPLINNIPEKATVYRPRALSDSYEFILLGFFRMF